ncbi:MAG: FlgD immunoglobulin-like domain containing protein, partial [Bacteroidota bacterium]
LWTDIDFSDRSTNVPGVDTTLQLGYLWEGTFEGVVRDSLAPAVGYVWLYGPRVASPGDTAVFRGRKEPGYKNLPLSSFWGISDDSWPDQYFHGPAKSMTSAWNIARGLDKQGKPIFDSTSNRFTRFPYSGDPVSGTGWFYSWPYRGGGSGFNMFSGPFTMAPGDTHWVMAALVPAKGRDRFDSIMKLRERAAALRSMPYDSLVQSTLPDPPPELLPTTTDLQQNYPNPFNAGTKIRFMIQQAAAVRLELYDLLGRRVRTLRDEEMQPGSYETLWDGRNEEGAQVSSGVYFCRMKANEFIKTVMMVMMK